MHACQCATEEIASTLTPKAAVELWYGLVRSHDAWHNLLGIENTQLPDLRELYDDAGRARVSEFIRQWAELLEEADGADLALLERRRELIFRED